MRLFTDGCALLLLLIMIYAFFHQLPYCKSFWEIIIWIVCMILFIAVCCGLVALGEWLIIGKVLL